jgi:hypothetical protein
VGKRVTVLVLDLLSLSPFELSNSVLSVAHVLLRDLLVIFYRLSFPFHKVVCRSLNSSFVFNFFDFPFFVVFQVRH